MDLHLTNKNAVKSDENVFPEQVLGLPQPAGQAVAYREPLYANPLQRTGKAISESGRREQLHEKTYRFRSNSGYIQELIPAPEYYKLAIRRLRNSLHSALVARRRVDVDLQCIEVLGDRARRRDRDEQPRLTLSTELYELRADLSAYVTSVRASLDILATVAQTVYGPDVGPFRSFTRLYGFLKKPVGQQIDPELLDYLNQRGEWLWVLRDIRDYISHYGAFHFSLFLDETQRVSVYVFRSLEIGELVDMIETRMAIFLEFIDKHWSSLVWERTAQH